MVARTETDRRETLRVQYAAVTARDIALGQWRFQAMVIFLTAVALIADHVKMQRRELASILIVLALGMLILDLRNRALVWTLRDDHQAIKDCLEGTVPEIRNTRTKFKLVSHTTVFDFSYGSVFGYALSLLLTKSGWPIQGVFAVLTGAVLVFVANRCRLLIQRRFGSGSAISIARPQKTPTNNLRP